MAVNSAAFTARNVVDCLIQCGITHVVWLPDTESGFLYESLRDEPRLKLVQVCREGEAVPLAAGLMVAGQKPVVVIQSTGLFESGDSIRGLAVDCAMPLLLLVGYRGYAGGGPSADSAANILEPTLAAWGVPYHLVDGRAGLDTIVRAYQEAQERPGPVAALICREYEG
jgi:sulfopyruvate decarboxylase TPP-binding subunit